MTTEKRRIVFEVPSEACGQKRPKARVLDGHGSMYRPKKGKDVIWENRVAMCFKQAAPGWAPANDCRDSGGVGRVRVCVLTNA